MIALGLWLTLLGIAAAVIWLGKDRVQWGDGLPDDSDGTT